MSNTLSVETEVTASAVKIEREIRALLRALGPRDTVRRKLLQARLRLLDDTKPLDMLAFAKQRVAEVEQLKRDAPTRAKLKKYSRERFRVRTRLPFASSGKVMDTRRDASGKKLYFELENGQAIEASRITGVRGAEDKDMLHYLTHRKHNHGQRRRLFKSLGNPVLVRIARRELAVNATR